MLAEAASSATAAVGGVPGPGRVGAVHREPQRVPSEVDVAVEHELHAELQLGFPALTFGHARITVGRHVEVGIEPGRAVAAETEITSAFCRSI